MDQRRRPRDGAPSPLLLNPLHCHPQGSTSLPVKRTTCSFMVCCGMDVASINASAGPFGENKSTASRAIGRSEKVVFRVGGDAKLWEVYWPFRWNASAFVSVTASPLGRFCSDLTCSLPQSTFQGCDIRSTHYEKRDKHRPADVGRFQKMFTFQFLREKGVYVSMGIDCSTSPVCEL